jgi:hypothetical protein
MARGVAVMSRRLCRRNASIFLAPASPLRIIYSDAVIGRHRIPRPVALITAGRFHAWVPVCDFS